MKICPKCKHKCDDSYMFCPACDFHMENVPPEDDVEEPIDIGGTLRKYKVLFIIIGVVVALILVFNFTPIMDLNMSSCQGAPATSSSGGQSGGSSGSSGGSGGSGGSGQAAGAGAPQEQAPPSDGAESAQPQYSSQQSQPVQSDSGSATQAQSSPAQESPVVYEQAAGAATGDECVLSMDGAPIYFASKKSNYLEAEALQGRGDTAAIDQLIESGDVYVLPEGTLATIVNNRIGGVTFVDITSGELEGSLGYVNESSLRVP